MSKKPGYQKAAELTARDLKSVAHKPSVRQLSRLTLPEIEAAVDLVSKIIPAGNVPGMILSGLSRLPGRRIPTPKTRQDVNALFSGVEQVLDSAMYGAFFAGPAAVIWGYQNLLKLAGKDPSSAFPEGVWQFYADYALREDTARHTNETHGFDTLLRQHNIQLCPADRLTARLMASITCLHQYDELLKNEWYERVAISLLEELSGERGRRLRREWLAQLPYRREEEAAVLELDYPAYRRRKFSQFLTRNLESLPRSDYEAWRARLKALEESDLPAYQKQMSILAYLDPGPYGETRVPFRLSDAQIGVIYRGNYYLFPVCGTGGKPLDVLTVRAQAAALLQTEENAPAHLTLLARAQRAALPGLRNKLDPLLVAALDNLRFAPILVSADLRPRSLPLSELRQAERGVGSHALTFFDTGESFVFDQSHIFFDGTWGMALSEIMTNEALSWARYLNMLPSPVAAEGKFYASLGLKISKRDLDWTEKLPRVSPEAGAETDKVNLRECLDLRRQFKQRSDLLQLTINDLLILYRAIHAAVYKPSKTLLAEIQKFSAQSPELAASLRHLVEEASRVNPAILIPMDASLKVPRERIYPLNMEAPLAELNLLSLHEQTMKMLAACEASTEDRAAMYAGFDRYQKTYLASLAGFGAILSKAKEIAIRGESASVGALKLLAHLPLPLQRILDKIPERFDLLNNILKGREVFSNVGAVAPGSSLCRFITAKDDNARKELAWGIVTDSQGVMRISLRDFRPHVAALEKIGRKDLANLIAQDYLNAYAEGLNCYIRDLSRIASASRESGSPISRKQRS